MSAKENSEKRRTYEKPRVISEKIFETSALGCTKCANANQQTVSVACVAKSKGSS